MRWADDERVVFLGSTTRVDETERIELRVSICGGFVRPLQHEDLQIGSMVLAAEGLLLAASEPPPRGDHMAFVILDTGRDVERNLDTDVLCLNSWRLFGKFPGCKDATLIAEHGAQ